MQNACCDSSLTLSGPRKIELRININERIQGSMDGDEMDCYDILIIIQWEMTRERRDTDTLE